MSGIFLGTLDDNDHRCLRYEERSRRMAVDSRSEPEPDFAASLMPENLHPKVSSFYQASQWWRLSNVSPWPTLVVRYGPNVPPYTQELHLQPPSACSAESVDVTIDHEERCGLPKETPRITFSHCLPLRLSRDCDSMY